MPYNLINSLEDRSMYRSNQIKEREHQMSTERKGVSMTRDVKPVEKQKRRTRAERREDSQSRILDASRKLLVERGYDAFSLQDVGRLAGCSHELINHYFGNKDGLLNALAEHIVNGFSADVLQINRLPHAFENLAQHIRYFAAVADRDFLSFSAYMRIASEAPFRPTLSALVIKRREVTLSVFIDSIKEGQAAGDIRDDINPEEYAYLIYEYLRGHTDVRILLPHARSKVSASADIFIEMLRVALTKHPRQGAERVVRRTVARRVV